MAEPVIPTRLESESHALIGKVFAVVHLQPMVRSRGGAGSGQQGFSSKPSHPTSSKLRTSKNGFLQSITRQEAFLIQQAFQLHQAGKLQEAEEKYLSLINSQTKNILVYVNLSSIYGRTKRHDEAIKIANLAITLNPSDTMALSNLGQALASTGKSEDAILVYRKALAIRHELPMVHCNLGNALTQIGDYENGILAFNEALSIQPNYPDASYNLGVALKDLGELDAAMENLNRAIEQDSGHVEARYCRCLIMLLQQNFSEAWEHFEYRWKSETVKQSPPPSPSWHPRDKEKRVIVIAELGVGDQINFGTMIPDLKRVHEDIIVLVDPRLLPLMQRSLPQVKFQHSISVPTSTKNDAFIAMGSLGRHFRQSLSEFPASPAGYLVADQALKMQVSKKIRNGEPKLVCGISWRSTHPMLGASKSMSLMGLAGALARSNVKLISLQYGETQSEISQLQQQTGIEVKCLNEIDNFKNLDDLAALIDACDIVISVSNTTVHLACGLGKPTWVLLQHVPLPRWGIKGSQSPWYPSARLFRQPERGNWQSVLDQVSDALDSLISGLAISDAAKSF
ncbi:tetratricopeptide repeat-containing glycosyltransferase family protein [Synechococcus sp. CS-602]|uniref:tetratricopeptide repeat-containing glycosyltransferase family protein n=1 Tax=Synechococcaceae TaxID=1890426 RepID=UPI0011A41487|nr:MULTISPECIES: tetratricopeptide repeat-containing glycosyltransferase family protein [Synechococcaceae]MCT0205097.1 tetratricopeptide repeat-containing glycosyltransferase family protein [Synechococcus sp. CS-602]MCT0245800.1 tetratricopeptide repeat-containing glycosyltransferase family protein [Synechococcus sp. CS-601]MCT4365244.1 tetratricopeptide repeat-containing glycosyltransferase family protein [Candidatus Regnicoccus frigidus MAG-AL1]MCT4367353.1 tetratricopeptide repeat-containing